MVSTGRGGGGGGGRRDVAGCKMYTKQLCSVSFRPLALSPPFPPKKTTTTNKLNLKACGKERCHSSQLPQLVCSLSSKIMLYMCESVSQTVCGVSEVIDILGKRQ